MTVWDWILLNVGILLYVAGAIACFAAVRSGSARTLSRGRAAAFLAACVHGALLVKIGAGLRHFPATNLFEFTLLFTSLVTLLALAIDLLRRMPVLTVGIVPLALVMSVIALMLAGETTARDPKVTTIWAAMHVIVTLVSFGSFAIAFVCGLLYLFEQRELKSRPGTPILGILPPLETLYRLAAGMVLGGVALLTAGFLLGYLYARRVETSSSAWRTDPKVWLTTATWLAYLLVSIAGFVPALRGRRTAFASVVCFVLLIITFWATAFWSPFHNFR